MEAADVEEGPRDIRGILKRDRRGRARERVRVRFAGVLELVAVQVDDQIVRLAVRREEGEGDDVARGDRDRRPRLAYAVQVETPPIGLAPVQGDWDGFRDPGARRRSHRRGSDQGDTIEPIKRAT